MEEEYRGVTLTTEFFVSGASFKEKEEVGARNPLVKAVGQLTSVHLP